MPDLMLTTFDWVPALPRGYVRDLGVRWALEEAGLRYGVRGVPFHDRGAEHVAHQPFGQVPWLTDGALSIFESGAILLHLGQRSRALLPAGPRERAEVQTWFFAALNSVEMARLPWFIFKFSGDTVESPARTRFDAFLGTRLKHMESVLTGREWLSSSISIADVAMAYVLRPVGRFDGLAEHPACRDYVARATTRPAFVKAHADQPAHSAAADPGLPAGAGGPAPG